MGRRSQKIKTPVTNETSGYKTHRGTSKRDSRENSKYEKSKEYSKDAVENKSESKSGDILPYWLPWILFPVTLCLRVLYVLEPTNWWILHPDENFQTIEVAHTDVYGYGFRTYEYLSPPSNDDINSTTVSTAHAQEIHFGMYSLRSFLLSKIISCVMVLSDACGINNSPYLTIKLFHVLVTSLLPVVVFLFSRTLHCSRDIGCLSAVLVSSSLTLNTLGTHTLINSFLSPFVFLCLIPLVSLLKSLEIKTFRDSKHSEICRFKKSSIIHVHLSTSEDSNKESVEKVDGNENISDEQSNNEKQSQARSGQLMQESNGSFSSHDENANCICLKDKLNGNTKMHRGFIQSDNTITKMQKQQRSLYNIANYSTGEVIAGIGLALCIYIRIDLILIPLLLIVGFFELIFINVLKCVKTLKCFCLGIAVGILIGGYCDYVTYGQWFLSPYQWYTFNVRKSFAGLIFGVNSFFFYLNKLYQNEPLVMMSLVVLTCDVLLNVTHSFSNTSDKRSHSAKNQSIFIFILLLIAFSLNNHKELRFLHNAVVFLYIAISCAILSLLYRFIRNQNGHQYSTYIVYIFIAIFTSSHYYKFINMKFEDRATWTYGRSIDSHETNICLDFIRQRKNVTGVFMDRSIQISGVYSILHRDVPIFALNIFEYIEFRKHNVLIDGTNLEIHNIKQKSFSTFSDVSDFISIYNSKFVYKRIRQMPEYNFLILRTDNNFVGIGYDEVFRVGNSKVLTRKFKTKKERELANSTDDIKMFWNATILEYEGYWLKHYGLYTKAEQRLMLANRIDPRRIGVFKILLDMYDKLKRTDDYTSVLKACEQLYKKSECLTPYSPIVLHQGYSKKD